MSHVRVVTRLVLASMIAAAAWFPHAAGAQASDSAHDEMPGMAGSSMDMAHAGAMDVNMSRHMRLTPTREATRADSVRARALVTQIRAALAKYGDTTAAVADGYRMFAPQLKQQRVFHFTSWRNAIAERFRFDPTRPTSLLYSRASDGSLRLVGAMYTAPRRWSADRLDARVPLSIARWHVHVDWCVPPAGERARWLEQRDGAPVFGPESPIDTRSACDAVGGRFVPAIFGWMVHVNAFSGNDLGEIFGEEPHAASGR